MKYVIIGNSAAGIGAVEGIRQIDKQGEITVISNEPHHTYSRPLISYLLLGKTTEEKMRYRGENFYKDNGVQLIHAEVTSIDANGKQVTISNEQLAMSNEKKVVSKEQGVAYDKLLVAAGSSAFVPPFEGLDTVKNKFTFMSLDDAKGINEQLAESSEQLNESREQGTGRSEKQQYNLSSNNPQSPACVSERPSPQSLKKVLIIGAGLIGLKCAEGIAKKVSHITVIDLAPRILSSILDEDGAKIVQSHIEKSASVTGGAVVEFKLGCSVKKFDKNTATLDNGEKLNFDLLVLAVGVRPNTALLDGIAKIERGIVVNEKSETSATDIFAAGDCTQTLDISSGQNRIMALLPNAYMQGECAGINMAGGEKTLDKLIPMNAIGFFGLHMITAGNYVGDVFSIRNEELGMRNEKEDKDKTENNRIPHSSLLSPHYKKLFYSDNKLNGYILIGNVEKAGIYTSLIRERTPLDSIDFALVCEKPGLMAFTKEDRLAKLGGTS